VTIFVTMVALVLAFAWVDRRSPAPRRTSKRAARRRERDQP
jgi:hypothetical protein